MKLETGWDVMDGRFILKMKDGSLITSEQLEGLKSGGNTAVETTSFYLRGGV